MEHSDEVLAATCQRGVVSSALNTSWSCHCRRLSAACSARPCSKRYSTRRLHMHDVLRLLVTCQPLISPLVVPAPAPKPNAHGQSSTSCLHHSLSSICAKVALMFPRSVSAHYSFAEVYRKQAEPTQPICSSPRARIIPPWLTY